MGRLVLSKSTLQRGVLFAWLMLATASAFAAMATCFVLFSKMTSE